MRSSREAIYSALFALIDTPVMAQSFNTIARTGELWTAFASADFPVLQQIEPDESYTYPQGDAAPPKVILSAEFWIYIRKGDPNIPPSPILNPLIDAVENAILPAWAISPYSNQTLGGLVAWTRIDGGSHKAPGYIDDVGMALIPIKILVPF
jgi:hypothetical protein